MAHAPGDTMGATTAGNGQDASFWRSHTTIALQPVAPPSILGLFGFAAATFMVSGYLAGWYGRTTVAQTLFTPVILFPFALFFGGLAQFLAGMWSYKARDGVATAMHGMWGSFWLAFGIYFLLARLGVVPIPALGNTALTPLSRAAQLGLGWWFIVLAAITWAGFLAALATNIGLALVLGTLAAGSTILAIAWVTPYSIGVTEAAGDVLAASAVIAFYTATALMLEGSFKRPVLPTGHLFRGRPVRARLQPIQFEYGEPGVKAGQ